MQDEKIGKLKKGDVFEMDGRQYIITRSGRGNIEIEFRPVGGKQILSTVHKNIVVTVITTKP